MMCGAELQTLPGGVQRVAQALQQAGPARAVFRLQPADLTRLTGASHADVVVAP